MPRGAGGDFSPCGGGIRWRDRILMAFPHHESGNRNALIPQGEDFLFGAMFR